MKILTVSQFYTPDITAAAFRIAETVGYLRDSGNEVEVVTTYPHKSKEKDQEISREPGVHRVRLPETENRGFIGYIYCYVTFMLKSIIKGYAVGRKQQPDVVWASSPPIFVGLAGWVVARLLGAKFALDIRDIWPDSAVAAGQLSNSGFAYLVGKWMERFLYTHADVITCVAVPMQNYIKEYTDREVEVIYNGVETKVSGNNKDSGEANAGVLDEFATDAESKKILYAGNFGHVQQLDLLISAYEEINVGQLNYNWEIFFLGNGVQKERMKNLVSSYDLSGKIHFLDPVPKHEVFAYLSSADVLFIHLMDSEVLRLTIPSKVFDYMLVNHPLLAGIHGEGKRIIDESYGNVTFESGNKDHLMEAFIELDDNLPEYSAGSDNARVVRERYSRESQSKKLNQLLKGTL